MKHASAWWLLLLLIPIGLGLSRLSLDVEVLNLLPGDLRVVEGLRLHQTHFADAQEILVTVTGPEEQLTTDAARNIAQRLRQEPTVRQVYWEAPWRESARGASELLAYIWLNQEPREFQQMLSRVDEANLAPAFANARERLATSLSPEEIALASYDPLGMSRLPGTSGRNLPGTGSDDVFSSADGKFRVVFVQAKEELKGYRECQLWVNTIRSQVEKAVGERYGSNYFAVDIGYTGRPVFTAEAAAEMQHDMTVSVTGTTLVIACLFWLAHRRVKPMLWLLILLGVVLTITLALGGLVFGTINVIAVGFAAILLGLAVDYAVVHYQEALEHPAMSIPQIRRAITPSILWAAVTTAAAFLVLNMGGLPGLAQLGTLVAIGIVVSALVMIFAFLAPLFPNRWTPGATAVTHQSCTNPNPGLKNIFSLAFVCAMGGILVWRGAPGADATADPLRSANSQAFTTMSQVIQNLGRGEDPYWLVCKGASPEDVSAKLREVERTLESLGDSIADYSLPTLVWPNPANRSTNLEMLSSRSLRRSREAIRAEALEQGFSEQAIGLANSVLETLEAEATSGNVLRDSATIRFILDRAMAQSGEGYLALGFVRPAKLGPDQMNRLEAGLNTPDVWLTGWSLLGKGIYAHVRERLIWLLVPVVGLILLALSLAFRRWQEVCLSICVLGVSALGLLGLMSLTGWSWNLLNLVALPLLLGTGVDYSIFTQLALRRHKGDLAATHRSVGRAVLLCGATAIAGFGSLALSNNRGMASLGTVCAAGIAFNMLISVYLLPSWWLLLTRPARFPTSGPSSFYSVGLWRAGMIVGRTLPRFIAETAARIVMLIYWLLAGHRRRVVESNLLPLCNGNRAEARHRAKRLFMNFGIKMIDLWRYESGSSIEELLGEFTGWEGYVAAKSRGRGVLFVGVHLGNWEFGGPCLTQRGIPLTVLTMAEPSDVLTVLRQANRARWNVQTSVVRNDPFAFLEPVKRLEEGGTVAILIDRPVTETSARVKLFGRDIAISSAAAELARASGCALLPVCIVRQGRTYGAHILPEVPYDRAALRERSARDGLTQALMDVLAPHIARNSDQWYHFVSIWPEE